MRTLVRWIRTAWAHEPLVLSGIAAAVGEAVIEDAQDGHLSWHFTVPVAIALIVRQYVTSPASRAQLEADLDAARRIAEDAGAPPTITDLADAVAAELAKREGQ